MTGIYKISNKITGDFYVGSSTSIKHRWWRHTAALNKGEHWNQHFQNSWNKYSEVNFEFVILEECETNKLQEREQHYIDVLNPTFNVCRRAYTTAGVKHSEVTKKKISESNKGKHSIPWTDQMRINYSKARKGIKNPEHSLRMKGRIPWNKGKKTGLLSEEHKRKIGLAHKGMKYEKKK